VLETIGEERALICTIKVRKRISDTSIDLEGYRCVIKGKMEGNRIRPSGELNMLFKLLSTALIK